MELARSIVSRLRRYVGDRRHTKRQEIRLPFSISVSGPAKNANGSPRTRTLQGHTLDISAGGMSLIVPTIRLGEYHLVGENRGFTLRLELPVGPIEMLVSPVRYEALEEHETESGFLIGVKIVEMSQTDRVQFAEYFSTFAEREGQSTR